jgi:hypothetical protein
MGRAVRRHVRGARHGDGQDGRPCHVADRIDRLGPNRKPCSIAPTATANTTAWQVAGPSSRYNGAMAFILRAGPRPDRRAQRGARGTTPQAAR